GAGSDGRRAARGRGGRLAGAVVLPGVAVPGSGADVEVDLALVELLVERGRRVEGELHRIRAVTARPAGGRDRAGDRLAGPDVRDRSLAGPCAREPAGELGAVGRAGLVDRVRAAVEPREARRA